MAAEDFVGAWTVRGLLYVLDDLYLLPGDVFSLEENTNGSFYISVKGNTDPRWENCDELGYVPGPPASIPNLPILTSQTFANYEAMLTGFISNPPDPMCEHLHDVVQLDSGINTDVTIFVIMPAHPRTKRVILVKVAPGHQNGTAHGDD